MNIKTIFLTLLLVIIASPVSVHAEAGVVGSDSPEQTDVVEDARLRARERILELQEKREQAKEENQEKITNNMQAMEQKREEIQVNRAEQGEARCEQVSARIANRANQYQQSQEKWSSRYNGVHKRVTDLADTFDDRGCGTSQMRDDLETFEDKISAFTASFRLFHTKLQGSKAYVCGDSQGEYKDQVKLAQNQLVSVKAAAQDLSTFVNDILNPHIRQSGAACKAQLSNDAGEEE